jgi:hypothetical protein
MRFRISCVPALLLSVVLSVFLGGCQVTLTTKVTPAGAGSTDPDGGDFQRGSVVSMRAIPDVGWVFHQWEGDLAGSDQTIDLLMDSDKSVTAVFTDNLIGTWINPAYNGRGGGPPGKLVYEVTQANTLLCKVYENDFDTDPLVTAAGSWEAKWIDGQDDTWYKSTVDWSGQQVFGLAVVRANGTTLESNGSFTDFPASIDPGGQMYGIFYRVLPQPTQGSVSTPVPLSPADGSTVNITDPVLSWIGDGNYYMLNIVGPGDVYNWRVNSDQCHVGIDITPDFDDGETFMWRVRAYKNSLLKSGWSEFRRVHVDTGQNQKKGPVLLSPADGAIITTATPALTWQDIGTQYHIYIWGPNDTYSMTVSSASCQIGVDIMPQLDSTDGTMFWEVQALVDGEWSTWSEARSFTVSF